jgi:hypothetical protein
VPAAADGLPVIFFARSCKPGIYADVVRPWYCNFRTWSASIGQVGDDVRLARPGKACWALICGEVPSGQAAVPSRVLTTV